MSSIEEIDKIFDIINQSNVYLNRTIYHDKFFSIFDKIILSEDNIEYVFDKIKTYPSCFVQCGSKPSLTLIKNKSFKIDFIYKNHTMPLDYWFLGPKYEVDSSYIMNNLNRNWPFVSYFFVKYFTFPQLMRIFDYFKHYNIFFEQIIYNTHNSSKILGFLAEYEDFDFKILSFDYPDKYIKKFDMKEFIKHPNFEMEYVRTYPRLNWDWDLLTLHGKMTQEEASNFLHPSYEMRRYKFKNKIMDYFDNLMIQPWMNVDFIHKYIHDENDRKFFINKISI